MKLYRVEWDFDDYYGSFEEAIEDYMKYPTEPHIPLRPMKGEDMDTPRVCLSDSILGCINAIGPGILIDTIESNIKVTNISYLAILVHEFDIDVNDKNLIKPSELVQRGLVPDALQNNEYWYLENIKQTDIKPYFLGLESMTYEELLEYYEKNRIPVVATSIKLIDPSSSEVQDYRWSVKECSKFYKSGTLDN